MKSSFILSGLTHVLLLLIIIYQVPASMPIVMIEDIELILVSPHPDKARLARHKGFAASHPVNSRNINNNNVALHAAAVPKSPLVAAPPAIAVPPPASNTADNNSNDNNKAAATFYNPPPIYPIIARRLGLEGIVTLRLMIDASGYCRQVEIAISSGVKLLDKAALKAVKNWRFNPAIINGSAIAAVINLPINFKLTAK